jgi:hypothetical protein
MTRELPFNPLPVFSGSHQQTIIGTLLVPSISPSSATKIIELSDKDKLALEITTPHNW